MRNPSENTNFTWGDSVRVKKEAPSEFRPGDSADVVAITEIETQSAARHFSADLGSKVYQIEFVDGRALEVPQAWLEPD